MSSTSINDLLESLKVEYLGTLPERLDEIEALILGLPENSDAQSLLRAVHSLKGAAGTHGFHIYTKICHQMEDMMRELISSDKIHSQAAVNILLDYKDIQNTAFDLIASNNDNFSIIDQKLSQINSSGSRHQKRILVVEPSPLYSFMIDSVLKAENCQVTIVSDGLIALENLLMQTYDVVITAMEMPVLNGDALVSALRISKGKNKDINAILITSKDVNLIEHSNIFNHIVNRNIIKEGLLPSLIL